VRANVKQATRKMYLKTNTKSESNLAINMKIDDNILVTVNIKHDGKIRLLMKVKPTDNLLSKINMELELKFGLIMNSNHLNMILNTFRLDYIASHLMPYREITVFYSESHNRHTNKVTTELQQLKLNENVNWRYM
jgi:hypothetical protein